MVDRWQSFLTLKPSSLEHKGSNLYGYKEDPKHEMRFILPVLCSKASCVGTQETSNMKTGSDRRRSKRKNNSKRRARNMEGRNVSAIRGKSPKENLTIAKDQTILLTDGCNSPYNRSD